MGGDITEGSVCSLGRRAAGMCSVGWGALVAQVLGVQ